MALAWKAGWVNALRGSNPLSSALDTRNGCPPADDGGQPFLIGPDSSTHAPFAVKRAASTHVSVPSAWTVWLGSGHRFQQVGTGSVICDTLAGRPLSSEPAGMDSHPIEGVPMMPDEPTDTNQAEEDLTDEQLEGVSGGMGSYSNKNRACPG